MTVRVRTVAVEGEVLLRVGFAQLHELPSLPRALPIMKYSGKTCRVGISLDFVGLTTRAEGPQSGCIARAGSHTESN